MRISDWSSDVCSSDLTSLLQVDFPLDGIDLAIRMGAGPFPRLYAQKLVTEQLVPVCSPGFAASIDPPLRPPADLGRATPTRQGVVSGKSVSVRVDLGGRRHIKNNHKIPLSRNN